MLGTSPDRSGANASGIVIGIQGGSTFISVCMSFYNNVNVLLCMDLTTKGLLAPR